MNVRLIREIAQTIVVLIACVFVVLLVVGCASAPMTHDQCNATKYATAMEHEQCLRAAADYEQLQHEKEDRRLIKMDELISFLNACDKAPHLLVMETRHGRACLPTEWQQVKARKVYGYPYTHENVRRCANRNTVTCTTPEAIMDALRRAGL
jgi:hypothetical protein